MSQGLTDQTWVLTGAGGMIGRGLREYLRGRVGRLICADLAELSAHDGDEDRKVDVRDADAVVDLVDGADGVIHLAGLATEAPWQTLMDVNIAGTYHVLEAMRQRGVRKLVYASSNRATGCHRVETVLNAQSRIRPDGLYGASKAACEALTSVYSDKFGILVTNIRIGTFGQRPRTTRELATWLSIPDAWRAFDAAMACDRAYHTFYGVSRNRDRFWDLADGEAIGFHPQDDASELFGEPFDMDPTGPQAGPYGSAQYTLTEAKLPH